MNIKKAILISVVVIMVFTGCQPKSYRLRALTPPNPTHTPTPEPTLAPTPTLAEPPADYPYNQLPGWIALFKPDFGAECGGVICTYLAIIRPDFSGERQLTNPAYGMPGDIVWSQDGRFIAYVYIVLGETGGFQLWVYDMLGGQAYLMTPIYMDPPYELAWSPDSHYLLYSYQVKDSGVWQLVKLDISTNGLTVLLDGTGYTDIFPTWSRTGESIIFSARKNDGTHLIWSMAPDGFNVTALSSDISVSNLKPSWKPDGSSLAYYQQDSNGLTELWTMDFDGFHPRKQVELGVTTVLETPVWSPDGKFLTVVYGTGKKTKVLLLELETGASMEVNRNEGNFTTISWSPNSQAFIYMEQQGTRGDVLNLFILNEGNPFAVDTPVEMFMNPVWSPVDYKP